MEFRVSALRSRQTAQGLDEPVRLAPQHTGLAVLALVAAVVIVPAFVAAVDGTAPPRPRPASQLPASPPPSSSASSAQASPSPQSPHSQRTSSSPYQEKRP